MVFKACGSRAGVTCHTTGKVETGFVDIVHQLMFNDITYYIHSQEYKMADGEQLCRENSTSLFVPESEEEYEFVYK